MPNRDATQTYAMSLYQFAREHPSHSPVAGYWWSWGPRRNSE